jgi:penicillin-binding protein 1C
MTARARIYAALQSKRARVLTRVIAAAILAPILALLVTAALLPLPPALLGPQAYDASTEIRDRHGTVLRELRAGDGKRARFCPIDSIGEAALRAVIAAEDKRFEFHPGVDPIAVLRAAAQAAASGRVVSGASTISQQLARNLVPRPRTIPGKFLEMALAVRIEASLSKRAILEQYMNQVAFGPGLRGIEAASRFYFDKPPRDLSLAEAAALAGIPRGPSLYDPRKGKDRLLRRRDRILDRMLKAGAASPEDVLRAKAEPLELAPRGGGLGAPHLTYAVLSGALSPASLEPPLRGRAASISLTIDRGLQRELEVLAQSTVRDLASRRVTAASLVVLDNATGEILAYVGSPDIEDAANLGHNDGVLALRQPGSTLKPFLYGLAMERLGFTAATALPDVAIHFPEKDGDYHPQNYDGRFHGPVRLREALANSYNVPAVVTAEAVGVARALDRLQGLGFASLDKDAATYGLALALGDGEVRLIDLANAYATLARGGLYRPVRAVLEARDVAGAPVPRADAAPRRVLDEAVSHVLIDILSDKSARLSSFGENSALDLPFPAAAKTGTSKGFRDNYAVGFTPDFTVAVWVGNFDGSPMEGVSGVTGAGPLFQAAMLAASRLRPPRPFDRPAQLLTEATVCALSGEAPGPACPHTRRELFVFVHGGPSAGGPTKTCSMHEIVRIERRSGLRAGPACPDADVEERAFERYDARLAAWAKAAGRPLAPEASSPRCPARPSDRDLSAARHLRVAYPPDGAAFAIDPALAAPQAIRIRADVPPATEGVRLLLDGRPIPLRSPQFFLDWSLIPGAHTVRVEASNAPPSDEIAFTVDAASD